MYEAHCQNSVQKAVDAFGWLDVLVKNGAYRILPPGGIADPC